MRDFRVCVAGVSVARGAAGSRKLACRAVEARTRCPIPDIDPATALSSPEVGDTLRTYRADARVDGGITFGMNCIVIQGVEHMLKVGQSVGANYKFE